MLFTDLDPKKLLYSGHNIEAIDEKSYINHLICRCALYARKKGYNVIGLQNHGKIVFAVVFIQKTIRFVTSQDSENIYAKAYQSGCMSVK